MIYGYDSISDVDCFFYYEQIPLDLATQSDLMQGLMQSRRSYFYNRSGCAGVSDWENHPNNLMLEIKLRYDIANWIHYNNTLIGDGTNGTIDRRVAVSQFSMIIERNTIGELNIQVLYIPYADYSSVQSLTTGVKM